MTPQSLLTSAAINISLALVILSFFSILKKQPSNAYIYCARRVSENRPLCFDQFSFRRMLPSISWIPRAFQVSEDEIVRNCGLDALVILRLFRFGINFFIVCSLIGLVVLVPLNFTSQEWQPSDAVSMHSFVISNVSAGSNRLWVHLLCLWFVSLYGLYLLYKENKTILSKRVQEIYKQRHRPDQFTILVQEIPLCPEHLRHGCNVNHFFSRHYPASFLSYQMLYNAKDLDVLLNEASSISRRIKNLREKSSRLETNDVSPLIERLRGEDSKIVEYEENLKKLCDAICGMKRDSVLQKMELPVAFATFKRRVGAALAAQSQQHPHPFTWMTKEAPEARDVLWKNLGIPSRQLLLNKIGFFVFAALLTIFFAVPVTAVQGIAKFETLKKWFPPAMAVQLIPGFRSVVTGYLPSVILNGFIYVVPFVMLGMANLAGCISRSKLERKVCNTVFYFLVGNVFFLSLLSGSLLDELGESFTRPRNFPSHLARAVAAQADFFTTYILTDGLSGFSLEVLQAGLLIWDAIKSHTFGRGKKKSPYLFSLPYFRVIPSVSLSILIGMVYAVVAPLLLPFLVGYLYLGYAVYVNQMEDVYETVYETFGQYWPCIHQYICFGIILMQITMIGLFGLKSKPGACVASIPLLALTILFNEYCKLRFLPSFKHHPIQVAHSEDELDESDDELKEISINAVHAYRPPYLRPFNFAGAESSSCPQC